MTGGAGFIGSHLVDRLVEAGNDVTVIDDLSTGNPDNLRTSLATGRVKFAKADVADMSAILPHFEGVRCVFHLAALADIVPSVENPLRYHTANADGSASVMEAAREAGVERVVYAASSSCYGIPGVYPTPESAPMQPQYPYALTKMLGEQIVLHWGQVYGTRVASLRLFNVYGPRARTSGAYGAVFGVFLAQKLAGKALTIVGDGTQTRDFTYVSDVVGAFVTAASSDIKGEVFNIGSGGTYSVNRLAELIGGDVVHIAERPGEPACTLADITKARSLLGWRPEVSFERGVRNILSCIDDWRGAPVWTPDSIEEATKAWFDNLAVDPVE